MKNINTARRGVEILEQSGHSREAFAVNSVISEAELSLHRSNSVSKLKAGDTVVMHTCGEADDPKYAGRIWTCKTDAFRRNGHNYCSVFLEGFSGSFSSEFLQKVDVKELSRLQAIEQALQKFSFPNGSARDVFDWLESTTGYRSE